MEMPYLRHTSADTYDALIKTEGKTGIFDAPKAALLPEFVDLENFLFGFLSGSTFLGNAQCVSSMNVIIYQAFEIMKYREVYNPAFTMKAVIAAQKLQEGLSLFYT